MRKIKKILFAFIMTAMLMICLKVSEVNAASYSITASQSTVTVGTTVTLTASVNAGSWNLKITGNGISQPLLGETTTTSNTSASASASFTPTEPGTYTFYLTGDVTDYETEVTETGISKSVTITVNPAPEVPPTTGESTGTGSETNTESQEKPNANNVPNETQKPTTPQVTKSSNNYLSGITIGTGTLSPEFYRETFEYIVEFDDTVNLYDLKEIEISATAEDNRATVEGAGTIQLNDGENNITLTVTAENGTARTYTIKVVKPMPVEQSALRLQTLVLNGINTNGEYQTINIEFDPETFDYDITVPNEITAISINPTTENEDIIIEATGGESLNEGDNRIIIILTSPSDETIKTTYTINVERQAALVTEEQGLTKEQLGIMIIASVVGVILLIVIIVAIVKHVRKKKRFDYDDEDEDVEMPLINNEEGEDVGDYDDIEDPYPSKIVTSGEENKDEAVAQEQEEGNQEELKETNTLDSTEKSDDDNNKWFGKKDKDDELKFKTTYDEENTVSDDTNERKSKWDDFVDGYDDDDEAKAKKKKHGKRFL